MPGGSKYEGQPVALEAYRSAVEASRSSTDVKGAKNPYTSRNGHMFSFHAADGTMALRLSDELTGEFRSRYDSGDVLQYNATMRSYSSVPSELLTDTAGLALSIDRSWEWIGTLPAKPTRGT